MSGLKRILVGTLLAASWGALLESSLLLLRTAEVTLLLNRAGRLARVLEVAGLAGLAGLAAALVWVAWTRLRPSERSPAEIASAAGLLCCVWLLAAFLVVKPAPESITLTTDPISKRLPMMVLASALVLVLGAGSLRRNRGRWLLLAGPGVRLAACGLLAAGVLLPGSAGRKEGSPPDIFLVTVDTLRADHLGCYGYAGPTSPALDRLCSESVVFEQVMTPVPETVPAYTSLLSGRLPLDHGIFNNMQKARDELATVAEHLREAGYLTAAILDGALPGTFANLDQGFELVVQRGVVARTPVMTISDALHTLWGAARSFADERFRRDASVTTEAALRWLSHLPADRPLFLHVYWPHPHLPFKPPRRYLELVLLGPAHDDEAVRLYDAEIRFTDAQVERVLAAIARHREPETSWILFAADHGEELGRTAFGLEEPYYGHAIFLYDSSLHVPLIVRAPAVEPRREGSLASLASVAATLLSAAGLPVPADMEPPLRLEPHDTPPAPIYASVRKAESAHFEGPVERMSLRTEGWRLIETRKPFHQLELLRHGAESERPVLPSEHPALVSELLTRLHARFAADAGGLEELKDDLSEEERELLRSLGYLR